MRRILVTGASGFLGWNVCKAAARRFETIGIYRKKPAQIASVQTLACDLTDFNVVKKLMAEIEPDGIVHTAAMANPNRCQTHAEASYRINVAASENIAGLCADRQIPCLFTSTDLVFDGKNPPYVETDPVSPVCIYGEHKVAAEKGMTARYPKTTICRMALMFGPCPQTATSFIQPILADLEKGRPVNLFVDEFRTPMGAETAVSGLLLALNHPGTVLHLGGNRRISRHEFGCLAADIFGLPTKSINPCKAADIPMPAPRSADISFNIGKARTLGFKPLSLIAELETLKKAMENK